MSDPLSEIQRLNDESRRLEQEVAARPDPVSDLQRLMDWARTNGYRIGPVVEIHGLKLAIQDIRQGLVDGATPTVQYDTPENEFGIAAKDQIPTPGLDG